MIRLPMMTALAVATLALAVPMTARAADSNADSKYKYPPYSQGQQREQQSGDDYARAPDGNANAPAASSEEDEAPGASGERGDAPAYQGDAGRAPGPEDEPGSEDADGPDRAEAPPPQADEPPPPHRAEGLPPRDYAGLPRIEATASAPDRSIPYDIRRRDARRAAIEAWRGKAAERFGPEFSHWRMAEGKRVDCMPERGDGVVCIASGAPVRGFGRFGQRDRRDRY
jgi:hypothetical protein